MGVNDKIMSTEAEVLHPPAIVYSERDREEPDQQRGLSNWKLPPNRRYLEPAASPKVWVAVIVQSEVGDKEVM